MLISPVVSMTAFLCSQAMLTGPSNALYGQSIATTFKRSRRQVVSTRCLSEYNGPPPAWPGRAVIKEHSDKVKLPKVRVVGVVVNLVTVHSEW